MAGHIGNRNKIHPHKFNMWLVIAGIIMFFAAFTSAYIVMHDRDSWQPVAMPSIFWISTLVIVISSFTMHWSVKRFKQHKMQSYKTLITITALLGLLFLGGQTVGFQTMYNQGFTLSWNLSSGFLYVIIGAHMLHVLGGVIALFFIFFRAYRRKVRTYDVVPVEVVAIFWHFVDILWIYLYIFFLIFR